MPYQIGYRVGVAWARDTATYDQLKAIAQVDEGQLTRLSAAGVALKLDSLNRAAGLALVEAGFLTGGYKKGHREDPTTDWTYLDPGDPAVGTSTGTGRPLRTLYGVRPYNKQRVNEGLVDGVLKVWSAIRKSL